jgi:membrane-bound serine protease (ClpP class)
MRRWQWRPALLYQFLWLFLLGCSILLFLPAAPLAAQESTDGPLYQVQLDGVITGWSTGYIQRTLRQAEASDATALIIRLSSEGAVLRVVRPLAAEIAASNVPVVVYIAPSGTDSGAVGAYFLSAAHVAAMAPDTSFGSTMPLVNGTSIRDEQARARLFDEVAAQLVEWNERQERAGDWVDTAVREGIVLNNAQASTSEPPAINLVARDTDELLTLLDGRVVTLETGEQRELATLGRSPRVLEPTLWESLLMLLASPTVAFLLLVMAAMAIYAELVSPTVGILAGIGAVLLIAALLGLLALPVQWLSVLLIVLAFLVIGADLFLPSHGALTVVGLAMLILGALNLFDPAQAPGVSVALWAVVMVSLVIVVFAVIALALILRLRNRSVTTGQEGLVGRLAEVRSRLAPDGMVFVDGALWRAYSEDGEIEVGELVQVVSAHDLRLIVRRMAQEQSASGAGSHP